MVYIGRFYMNNIKKLRLKRKISLVGLNLLQKLLALSAADSLQVLQLAKS